MRRRITGILCTLVVVMLVVATGAGCAGPSSGNDRYDSGLALRPLSNSLTTVEITETGSGDWEVPPGVTEVTVEAWGGGGGGGAVSAGTGGAGGGGGGGYARGTVSVTPGDTYDVTVGAGGAGGTEGGDGDPGGSSSFTGDNGEVSASGGLGGEGGVGGTGGGGGSGSGNLAAFAGGGGADGADYSGGGGGGAGSLEAGDPAVGIDGGSGGMPDGGDGADGRSGGNHDGRDGDEYGGGGSGARRQAQDGDGGRGADGKVVISWTVATYTLTMAAAPVDGGTAVDVTAGSPYTAGTVVDIEATANAGYQFVSWTAPDGSFGDAGAATTTFTMPAEDVTVTANFEDIPPDTYIITATAGAGGSIDPSGDVVVAEGDDQAFTITADQGYEIDDVLVDGSSVGVVAIYTFSDVSSDHNIHATFTALPPPRPYRPWYALRISSTEGGSVVWPTGSRSQPYYGEERTLPYPEGRVVRLVAAADEGYRFHKWSGDVDTIADIYSPSTTIRIETWSRIHAHFVPEGVVLECDLTADSTTGGSVTIPGEGTFTYEEGEVVDLMAEPEEGYRFVNWTGDVATIGDVDAPSTTVTMYDDYEITANFERVFAAVSGWYALQISSTEGGSVTSPGERIFPYAAGRIVRLVAVPEDGYRFVEWTGDVESIADINAASTTIRIETWSRITATFESE